MVDKERDPETKTKLSDRLRSRVAEGEHLFFLNGHLDSNLTPVAVLELADFVKTNQLVFVVSVKSRRRDGTFTYKEEK